MIASLRNVDSPGGVWTMPIQIGCPSCRRQLRIPDNLVGQRVMCPGCKKAFTAVIEATAGSHWEPAPASTENDDRFRREEPRQKRSSTQGRPGEDDFDVDDRRS